MGRRMPISLVLEGSVQVLTGSRGLGALSGQLSFPEPKNFHFRGRGIGSVEKVLIV